MQRSEEEEAGGGVHHKQARAQGRRTGERSFGRHEARQRLPQSAGGSGSSMQAEEASERADAQRTAGVATNTPPSLCPHQQQRSLGKESAKKGKDMEDKGKPQGCEEEQDTYGAQWREQCVGAEAGERPSCRAWQASAGQDAEECRGEGEEAGEKERGQ